jgi:hypothetical protein
VTRLRPDSSLDHFASIRAAAIARAVDQAAIVWCLTTGCRDREGGRWVETREGMAI